MAHRTCPVWVGYLLLCPFRAFAHDPQVILGPHVREGMTVLDVGCAMGFMSLPLARMVGPSGKVVCVDLQEGMLRRLGRRAARAGLADRVELRACGPESLALHGLEGTVDFALAFMMVHEVGDARRLFGEIHAALKPGAGLLLAEPIFHVPRRAFEAELESARLAGFSVASELSIPRSRGALLRREPS